MPKVALSFKINRPFKKWKRDFDSQTKIRERLGIKVLHINHEPNNEREIQGIMEVSSLEGFKKSVQIEELNKKGHNIIANLLKNDFNLDH
tara:strand:- start:484 stop:753 length:270 start_codon:yes stop_codon:yes gene_type:complete